MTPTLHPRYVRNRDKPGERTMLKLYYAPHTCALASHIALEEAGATYETVRLNFKTEEQKKPAYLAINPKARVPALVTAQGILTETPAILFYIAQTHPAAKLAPSDPYLLGKAQAFNSYLCSTVHVAHAHRMSGRRWVDDEASILAMQKKVPQTVGECYAELESDVYGRRGVLGKDCSINDRYLFTWAQWLDGDGVALTKTPKIP